MDPYNQEQCNEKYKVAENADESYTSTENREGSRSRSMSQHREKRQTRSRSRTPNNIVAKRWASTNAFINFIQDFRQSNSDLRSTKLFQLAGRRWKEMSTAERQPYIDAAKNVRQQKQDQKETEPTNITKNNSEEASTKKGQKQPPEKKNKEEPKKDKNKDNSDTESDRSADYNTSESTVVSLDTSDYSS